MSVYFSLALDTRDRVSPAPVSVRVAYQGKKVYFRTGLYLTEEKFCKMLIASKGANYELRKEQEKHFNRVVATAKPLIDADAFSLAALKERLRKGSSFSINELFSQRIEELRADDKAKTARIYFNSLSKFESLFGENVPFSKVTTELMQQFKSEMEKDGLSTTTISIYLRNFRTICNIAIKRNLMPEGQYPFKRSNASDESKVRIPKGKKRKDFFLTIPDIRKIMSYDTEEHHQTPYEQICCEAVNLWMFSYLGNGMNLIDMAHLRYDDHYFKTKGREFSFMRHKTANVLDDAITIYVPITEPMRRILDRYGAPARKGQLVFPFILAGETDGDRIVSIINQWGKNISKRLRKVCTQVGVEEQVSMTWARHSYQTNLAHKKVPDTYIDQAVGHADQSVTDGYIGLYSIEDRFRYNSLLLEPDKEA